MTTTITRVDTYLALAHAADAVDRVADRERAASESWRNTQHRLTGEPAADVAGRRADEHRAAAIAAVNESMALRREAVAEVAR